MATAIIAAPVYDRVYYSRQFLADRHGLRCRTIEVVPPGKYLVEFEDGVRVVVCRFKLRLARAVAGR